MKRYPFKVPPGENLQVQVVGDYVRVESAAVAVIIEDPDGSQLVHLEEGDDARLQPFKHLYLRHDDAATQAVVIAVGQGTQKSSSRIGGSIVLGAEIDVSKASSFETIVDVGVPSALLTLAFPADITRRSIMITALDTNTETVRIGDFSTGATRGTPLRPGETITLETTDNIYAYQSSVDLQTLACSSTHD